MMSAVCFPMVQKKMVLLVARESKSAETFTMVDIRANGCSFDPFFHVLTGFLFFKNESWGNLKKYN